MLNHIGLHKNNLHNTNDGGQAMGEELRHVEMSRWTMHRGETEKSNQQQGLWGGQQFNKHIIRTKAKTVLSAKIMKM